jgi:WD40 repeat protein
MPFLMRLIAGLLVSMFLAADLLAETPALWQAWNLPAVQPLPDGARLRLGSGGLVLHVRDQAALSQDGKYLAIANDATCSLYERATGKLLARLPGGQRVTSNQLLGFSPDGRFLLYGFGPQLAIAEVPTGQPLRAIDLTAFKGLWAKGLAFSADGNFVTVTGINNRVGGEEIHIWALATGQAVGAVKILPQAGVEAALSPDGSVVAVANLVRSLPLKSAPQPVLQLCEVATGRELWRVTLGQGLVFSVPMAFSPDGRTLAVADAQVGLRLFEVAGGKERDRPVRKGGRTALLAYASDGQLVAVDHLGVVDAWPDGAGQRRNFPAGPLARPRALAFPAPGAIMLFGERNTTLLWWNAVTGKHDFPHEGHWGNLQGLAFSPGAPSLISLGDDAQLLTWNTATGALRRQGQLQPNTEGFMPRCLVSRWRVLVRRPCPPMQASWPSAAWAAAANFGSGVCRPTRSCGTWTPRPSVSAGGWPSPRTGSTWPRWVRKA